MAKLTEKTIRIIKTFNLYCCFIALGLAIAMPGPTLIDLTHIVNTNIKSIALIYTARSIGTLVGSLAGGVIFDWTEKKQLVFTISNLVMAVSLFGIPWSRDIYVMTVWMVINGLSLGFLDNGGNVSCLNLWGKDSGPFYQALQFTFGIGGLIAPFVAAPFLGDYTFQTEVNSTIAENISDSELQDFNFTMDSTIPPVTYAYTIIGFFAFLVAIMFFIMCFISPVDKSARQSESGDVNKTSFSTTFFVVLLAAILILTAMGTEVGYAQMLTTYANEGPLHLSTTTGSYMTSAYWAAFTVSRMAAIFLAIKCSNFSLIIFDVILTSIGSVILVFLAPYFEWALWFSSVVLGVGIASLFPSCVSWVDQYIPVTNKIASMFSVGACFGEMLIPFVISYFMADNPGVFVYVNAACNIVAILVITAMYLILRKLPLRFVSHTGNANAAYQPDE